MMVYLDMFCAIVELQVLGYCDCGLVVDVKESRGEDFESEFGE